MTQRPALGVARQLRILDFDSEVRPMHYSEFRPEGQITAIAWSWVGSDIVDGDTLAQDLSNERVMLERFLEQYRQADIVTGHYIRKHDLPLINEHAIRLGLPPIGAKLTSDTQADFTGVKSLGKSQENLALTFGVAESKHHMTGAEWRVANMLTPEGQALSLKRVSMDVRQHKALRAELLKRGLLKAPRMWNP